MTNPLLDNFTLPPFSKIAPDHVVPAIDQLLAEGRSTIDCLLEDQSQPSWDSLIQPLEDIDDRISKAWSPVSHMNSVVNSDPLRDAYNTCLPKLSAYATELGQNKQLFDSYQAIAESEEFAALTRAQEKIITNALRDFKLSGVALDSEERERFKEIAQQLSKLASEFEENLLDATNAWTKQIDNEDALSGLPESSRMLARQAAQQRELSNWLLTLEFPSYMAVITYADDRKLRREVYEAFATRASNQGPYAKRWDNSDTMEEILRLRHEKAQLLGYKNYAELSLVTKMAGSAEDVLKFLTDLAERSLPVAKRDIDELRQFARDQFGIESLEAWDMAYYSEKLRQHKFDFSQEDVKAYFPASKVVPGLFEVVNRLYGLDIKEIVDIDVWHPDVKFFEILDSSGALRGQFYLDPYARSKKRGGAWMDECVTRRKAGGKTQAPVAYLTCNFSPPAGDNPALLTHDEVITLFHEFGHGLHHMLTQVDYAGVSGIHGVEWDAVELPSQFMENWCWTRDVLDVISAHYQTGEKLPDSLFQKMLSAKNFQAGMQMVRQLEFALFDFRIHLEYEPAAGGRIYPILEQVREQVAVVKPPAFNRFAHSFSHIFAGGYGAGYYSYKWAEVLSSDAFSLFEEKGLFDTATGRSFLENVLEKGGSEDAMELFVAFRGREPQIDSLLRHSGIAA